MMRDSRKVFAMLSQRGEGMLLININLLLSAKGEKPDGAETLVAGLVESESKIFPMVMKLYHKLINV